MRNAKTFLSVAAVVAIAATSVVLAHSGATGIVKKRMDAMSDIGKNMKTIGTMLKGEAAFDGEAVKASASVIAGHAKEIPHLFPEGSNEKPTEALPSVWDKWDEFTAIASDLESAAGRLAEVASSAGDVSEIKKQFLGVAKTCKSCHEDFRLKKE
ncbi:MAG: c-type cytochrome [Hyphomicrobiales bacterium]